MTASMDGASFAAPEFFGFHKVRGKRLFR